VILADADEMQKLIEAKAKGQKREAPAPQVAKGNVIDLVAALQESPGSVKKGKNALSHNVFLERQGWLKHPSGISKQKQMPGPNFKSKLVSHNSVKSIEALSHVGRSNSHVDPGGRSKPKHRSDLLDGSHQAGQGLGVKISRSARF
jgi:hypothetical protein